MDRVLLLNYMILANLSSADSLNRSPREKRCHASKCTSVWMFTFEHCWNTHILLFHFKLKSSDFHFKCIECWHLWMKLYHFDCICVVYLKRMKWSTFNFHFCHRIYSNTFKCRTAAPTGQCIQGFTWLVELCCVSLFWWRNKMTYI